jgi:hypothetical protein
MRGGVPLVRPSRRLVVLAAAAVLAGALAFSTASGFGGRGDRVASAASDLTGDDLATELGLTKLPGKPKGCLNWVEVGAPAGYCIEDVVASSADSYRLGLQLRGMEFQEIDVRIFTLREEILSTPYGSDRFRELVGELEELEAQLDATASDSP